MCVFVPHSDFPYYLQNYFIDMYIVDLLYSKEIYKFEENIKPLPKKNFEKHSICYPIL